jgi:hypothetical protein
VTTNEFGFVPDQTQQPQQESGTAKKIGSEVFRHAERSKLRAVEAIAGGLPTGIQFIRNVLNKPVEKFQDYAFKQATGREVPEIVLEARAREKVPIIDLMRQTNEWAHGKEISEPHTPGEEVSDRYVQRLVNLTAGRKNDLIDLGRAGMASALGEAGRGTAELFNAPEWAKEAADIGATTMAYAVDPKALQRYNDKLWTDIRDPKRMKAIVSTRPLEEKLAPFKAALEEASDSPSKIELQKLVEDVDKVAKLGQAPLQKVMGVKNVVSEHLDKIMGSGQNLKNWKKWIPYLGHSVDEAVHEAYGQYHPDWWKGYEKGKQTFAGIENGRRAARNIEKQSKHFPLAWGLFKYGLGTALGQPHALATALKGVLKAKGTREVGGRLLKLNQWIKQPAIRSYMAKAMIEAAKDNPVALAKVLNSLENEMENEFKFTPSKEISPERAALRRQSGGLPTL